jgi:hypothetical protein
MDNKRIKEENITDIDMQSFEDSNDSKGAYSSFEIKIKLA